MLTITRPLTRLVQVMAAVRPMVVFVLGGPGAGKGTQCARIVEEYGFIHFSAGDLLRKERDSGSKDGALIQDHMLNGKIVPVEITINLIKKEMLNSEVKKFLIDGFPRNRDNLDGWYRVIGDTAEIKFVMFFDCPREVCMERVVKRGEGRTDDDPDVFRKRFDTYLSQTMPIIDIFEAKGLVRKLDATAGPDEVFSEVKKLFAGL